METTRTGAPARGTRTLAWAVLAAALLEVIAPAITIIGPGASPGGGSGPELLITPAGWAFSIWGVIYALAIAQAVLVLVRGAGSVPRRLQLGQLVLYLGATAWIAMAGLDSSPATAATLLVMFAAAADAVFTASRRRFSGRGTAALTRIAVGLYAGWVTAAVFLNVSTALVDLSPVQADSAGWQLVVLVAAAATLLGVALATRVVAYAVAGGWAMIGIAATAMMDDTTAVTVLALIALVLLLGAAVDAGRARTPRWGRS